MRLSLRKHCTCGSDDPDKHYLRCDLFYAANSYPRKRKRFGLFYPMREVR